MEETKNQHKPKGARKDPGELRVVSIEFNPGPDAQDRLRRLFTLLVKYATEDKLPAPDADSSSEDGCEVESLMQPTHSLTVISLGGGVQSSVMALMASQGAVDAIPDCAIFADTHWEPSTIYTHLDWLSRNLSFPLYVVDNGRSLREDAKALTNHSGNRGFIDLPLYRKGTDGSGDGMGRRQCTEHYKVRPIRRKIRDLLGLRKRLRIPSGATIELWLGISTDEAIRMRTSRHRWIRNRYPLIEARMSRQDCLEWWQARYDQSLERSACIGCPYQSRQRWAETKRRWPKLFAEVVEIDSNLRGKLAFAKEPYLHPRRVPLAQAVNLDEAGLRVARDPDGFGNECEGYCGV